MKSEGSVVQGELRRVAGVACVVMLWMGVWDATWGRERTPEHDRVFWESVECTVAAEVEAYLSEFPEGRYEREARACLDDLGLGRDEEEEWAERERRLELSREERRRIQEALEGLGLEPGGVDGWFGEGTREAIRRWEASRGREETGYLDVESARELLALGEERERARAEDEARKQAERERAERERLEAGEEESGGGSGWGVGFGTARSVRSWWWWRRGATRWAARRARRGAGIEKARCIV